MSLAAAAALVAVLTSVVASRADAPLERLDVADEGGRSVSTPFATTSTLPPPSPPPTEPDPATSTDGEPTPTASEPATDTSITDTSIADTSIADTSIADTSITDTSITDPVASASTDPPTTVGSPPSPQRIEAERMAVKTYGGYDPDAYRLYSDGYVADEIGLDVGGTYRFTVRARGWSQTSLRPELALSLGGDVLGTTQVDLDGYELYDFEAEVRPGSHELRVAFTNDPNRPGNDVDLIVDWVEVTWLRS